MAAVSVAAEEEASDEDVVPGLDQASGRDIRQLGIVARAEVVNLDQSDASAITDSALSAGGGGWTDSLSAGGVL